MKIVEQTNLMRYVSYARICVYLDISKELPESIKLSWHDEEWLQPIDYEHIPFCYCRCHEYGHLFWQCPLNAPPQGLHRKNGEKDVEGFEKVSNRKRTAKRNLSLDGHQKPQTANRFETLREEMEEADGRPEKEDPLTQSKDTEMTEEARRHLETME